jgi:uncharacterized RDD family membrane protein YckC
MHNNQILDSENLPIQNELVNASLTQRFVNNLVDRIVLYALIFATVLSGSAINRNFAIIAVLLIVALYYPITESVWGQSVGKLLTGTKVVDVEGNKISFSTAALRTICRIIPFEQFSFLFYSDNRGWHDTITKTRVVEK